LVLVILVVFNETLIEERMVKVEVAIVMNVNNIKKEFILEKVKTRQEGLNEMSDLGEALGGV
jgi:hypothetical protein